MSLPTILQNDDSYESDCDLPPSYSRHRRAIIQAMAEVADAGVAAERERCAKIADAAAATPPQIGPLYNAGIIAASQYIAARIREGQ